MTKTLEDYAKSMNLAAKIAGAYRGLDDDQLIKVSRILATRMFIAGAISIMDSVAAGETHFRRAISDIRAIHDHDSKEVDNL